MSLAIIFNPIFGWLVVENLMEDSKIPEQSSDNPFPKTTDTSEGSSTNLQIMGLVPDSSEAGPTMVSRPLGLKREGKENTTVKRNFRDRIMGRSEGEESESVSVSALKEMVSDMWQAASAWELTNGEWREGQGQLNDYFGIKDLRTIGELAELVWVRQKMEADAEGEKVPYWRKIAERDFQEEFPEYIWKGIDGLVPHRDGNLGVRTRFEEAIKVAATEYAQDFEGITGDMVSEGLRRMVESVDLQRFWKGPLTWWPSRHGTESILKMMTLTKPKEMSAREWLWGWWYRRIGHFDREGKRSRGEDKLLHDSAVSSHGEVEDIGGSVREAMKGLNNEEKTARLLQAVIQQSVYANRNWQDDVELYLGQRGDQEKAITLGLIIDGVPFRLKFGFDDTNETQAAIPDYNSILRVVNDCYQQKLSAKTLERADYYGLYKEEIETVKDSDEVDEADKKQKKSDLYRQLADVDFLVSVDNDPNHRFDWDKAFGPESGLIMPAGENVKHHVQVVGWQDMAIRASHCWWNGTPIDRMGNNLEYRWKVLMKGTNYGTQLPEKGINIEVSRIDLGGEQHEGEVEEELNFPIEREVLVVKHLNALEANKLFRSIDLVRDEKMDKKVRYSITVGRLLPLAMSMMGVTDIDSMIGKGASMELVEMVASSTWIRVVGDMLNGRMTEEDIRQNPALIVQLKVDLDKTLALFREDMDASAHFCSKNAIMANVAGRGPIREKLMRVLGWASPRARRRGFNSGGMFSGFFRGQGKSELYEAMKESLEADSPRWARVNINGIGQVLDEEMGDLLKMREIPIDEDWQVKVVEGNVSETMIGVVRPEIVSDPRKVREALKAKFIGRMNDNPGLLKWWEADKNKDLIAEKIVEVYLDKVGDGMFINTTAQAGMYGYNWREQIIREGHRQIIGTNGMEYQQHGVMSAAVEGQDWVLDKQTGRYITQKKLALTERRLAHQYDMNKLLGYIDEVMGAEGRIIGFETFGNHLREYMVGLSDLENVQDDKLVEELKTMEGLTKIATSSELISWSDLIGQVKVWSGKDGELKDGEVIYEVIQEARRRYSRDYMDNVVRTCGLIADVVFRSNDIEQRGREELNKNRLLRGRFLGARLARQAA